MPMTDEEYRVAQALDARVAEEVLGLEVVEVEEVDSLKVALLKQSRTPKRQWGNCWMKVKRLKDGRHLPRYSTEIAEAMDVLRFIHEGNDTRPRLLFSGRRRFYEALADQCVTEDGRRVVWPDALGCFREQMPLFICRAALAVVGANTQTQRG